MKMNRIVKIVCLLFLNASTIYSINVSDFFSDENIKSAKMKDLKVEKSVEGFNLIDEDIAIQVKTFDGFVLPVYSISQKRNSLVEIRGNFCTTFDALVFCSVYQDPNSKEKTYFLGNVTVRGTGLAANTLSIICFTINNGKVITQELSTFIGSKNNFVRVGSSENLYFICIQLVRRNKIDYYISNGFIFRNGKFQKYTLTNITKVISFERGKWILGNSDLLEELQIADLTEPDVFSY